MDINISSDKPANNEDIFNLLVRIHRLMDKVRSFTSMVRSIGALQRFVYEGLGLNKGGFILDVRVRLTLSIYSVLHI